MEYINMSIDERLTALIDAGRINSLSKLKNFNNLDASLMRFIIGPINVNTKLVSYSPIDVNKCKNQKCSIWQSVESIRNLPDALKDIDTDTVLSEEIMISDCMKGCKECPYNNVQHTTTYINPKKRYNLYNMARSLHEKPNIKFSKLLIKIMIVLQCWPAEMIIKSGINDGTLPSVYIPDLAKILDCNVNFLVDCLSNLGNLGLLRLDKLSPHKYDITLPNYFLKYKNSNQGSGGYIQIDKEILKQLLKEKSITALRGMILQLLSNPFANNTDSAKRFSLEEFRSIMPSYVSYQAQYDKALKNSIFSASFDKFTKQFVFLPKDQYRSIHEQKTELVETNIPTLSRLLDALKPTFIKNNNTGDLDTSNRYTINRILNNKNLKIPDTFTSNKSLFSFFKSALQVSVEYGLTNVIVAIKKIEYNYRIFGSEIKSAGAMLRSQCCYNLINGVT